jgi:hypothetical protein
VEARGGKPLRSPDNPREGRPRGPDPQLAETAQKLAILRDCHGSFGATHNLKAAGSNPAPATKKSRIISDFKAGHNARLLSFQILVNTWSTFYEPPIDGADNRRQYRHSTNS